MKITVVGLGKIGLPLAVQFASRGHEVLGADVNAGTDGHVVNTRGSVIPLFVSQIKAGRPLTITDPAMTRFMMSLDDSVDLVLHAYGHGRQGDIFVQKSPAATIGASGPSAGPPRPDGSGRRPRRSSAVRHALVAIRYSQVRTDERPSNPS